MIIIGTYELKQTVVFFTKSHPNSIKKKGLCLENIQKMAFLSYISSYIK